MGFPISSHFLVKIFASKLCFDSTVRKVSFSRFRIYIFRKFSTTGKPSKYRSKLSLSPLTGVGKTSGRKAIRWRRRPSQRHVIADSAPRHRWLIATSRPSQRHLTTTSVTRQCHVADTSSATSACRVSETAVWSLKFWKLLIGPCTFRKCYFSTKTSTPPYLTVADPTVNSVLPNSSLKICKKVVLHFFYGIHQVQIRWSGSPPQIITCGSQEWKIC